MKELYLDISTLVSSFRWSADIGDVGNVDSRQSIEHSGIERGSKVLVEYTTVSYPGKRAKEGEPGFNPGCTLQLLSLGLLGSRYIYLSKIYIISLFSQPCHSATQVP